MKKLLLSLGAVAAAWHVLKHADPKDATKVVSIGSEVDVDDAIAAKWHETEVEVKDANFVLYLQHNDADDAVKVQLSKVVEFYGKFFELDKEDSTMTNAVVSEVYNKEFALENFTATYTVPVIKA